MFKFQTQDEMKWNETKRNEYILWFCDFIDWTKEDENKKKKIFEVRLFQRMFRSAVRFYRWKINNFDWTKVKRTKSTLTLFSFTSSILSVLRRSWCISPFTNRHCEQTMILIIFCCHKMIILCVRFFFLLPQIGKSFDFLIHCEMVVN